MQSIRQLLNNSFPHLNDPKLIDELVDLGNVIDVKDKSTILHLGQYIEYVPLVLDGIVKVKRQSLSGDEVFLYYITRGESCAMTLSSCLKRKKSKITAEVVEDSKILLIPSSKLFFFMKKYTNWSEFVLETFWKKFDETIDVVERLAFMKLEDQVIDLLQKRKTLHNDSTIKVTHETLAKDLSTSRVIISRVLKKLEEKDKLVLGHKSIKLI